MASFVAQPLVHCELPRPPPKGYVTGCQALPTGLQSPSCGTPVAAVVVRCTSAAAASPRPAFALGASPPVRLRSSPAPARLRETTSRSVRSSSPPCVPRVLASPNAVEPAARAPAAVVVGARQLCRGAEPLVPSQPVAAAAPFLRHVARSASPPPLFRVIHSGDRAVLAPSNLQQCQPWRSSSPQRSPSPPRIVLRPKQGALSRGNQPGRPRSRGKCVVEAATPAHPRRPSSASVASGRSSQATLLPVRMSSETLAPTSPMKAAPGRTKAIVKVAAPPETLLDRVSRLLADRVKLKSQVISCFKRVAFCASGGLGSDALKRFKGIFAQAAGLPPSVLGDLETQLLRFDFSGSGVLELNEAYKLVKFQLRSFQRSLGASCPGATDVAGNRVPVRRSLAEAGLFVTKQLGQGSQGEALLARTVEGREYCVKRYAKRQLVAGALELLLEEFETLQLLACERLPRAYDLFQDLTHIYMVGEACYGGDFTEVKQRATALGISTDEAWWRGIFVQCLEALAFIHQQAIMHCDIKEPNMMLKTADFTKPSVVLIDLGVATAMTSVDRRIVGTPGYIPPETWREGVWYPKGDVFSLGVCILQLLTGKVPNGATGGGVFVEGAGSYEDIAALTCQREPPVALLPPAWPALTPLVRWMLEKEMSARPTTAQALEHPWCRNAVATAAMSPATSARSSPPLRGRHAFATLGITRSLLVAEGLESCSGDSEPLDALREVVAAATEAQREVAAAADNASSTGGTSEGVKNAGQAKRPTDAAPASLLASSRPAGGMLSAVAVPTSDALAVAARGKLASPSPMLSPGLVSRVSPSRAVGHAVPAWHLPLQPRVQPDASCGRWSSSPVAAEAPQGASVKSSVSRMGSLQLSCEPAVQPNAPALMRAAAAAAAAKGLGGICHAEAAVNLAIGGSYHVASAGLVDTAAAAVSGGAQSAVAGAVRAAARLAAVRCGVCPLAADAAAAAAAVPGGRSGVSVVQLLLKPGAAALKVAELTPRESARSATSS
eukprot:TRINITY_DN4067_c0_g1_i1.p1 TRINITY_DN4067_c0_g1~~TRINITY_DN4067_c0_g1_i1.p1  ORF type:complete len:1028 (+),score=217.73 TRINITY_DN4067_c0_g1_i1:58-3084(+)